MGSPADDRPLQAGDIVRVIDKGDVWGYGPVGHVEKVVRFGARRNPGTGAWLRPVQIAWVVLDDGTGTEQFQCSELERVDVAALERAA
jgi:hypothetical protein